MLSNVIKSKHKPYAILLVESKLCDLTTFIKDYMKSIVCIGPNCEWCHKIDHNSYYDVITINGYQELIKKEQIANIIETFNKSSIESRGIKFCIIYGMEYATAQAVNSLLKFLEEPPQNTYIILTTRSVNLVLPTIKSRCQTYIVKSDISNFDKQLSSFELDTKQKKIIKDIYFNYGEAINDLTSKIFYKSFDFVSKLISENNDLKNIKKLSEDFKKMDYKQIELILKMINSLTPSETLFELLLTIKSNPIKILLFNKLWGIISKV